MHCLRRGQPSIRFLWPSVKDWHHEAEVPQAAPGEMHTQVSETLAITRRQRPGRGNARLRQHLRTRSRSRIWRMSWGASSAGYFDTYRAEMI